jgi:uncharacterized protein (DUF697 family)
MSIQVFKNLKEAIGNLDPEEIRRHTERPVRLFLYAHSEEGYRALEDYFVPPQLTTAKRVQAQRLIHRASEGERPSLDSDLEIYFDDSSQNGWAPTSRVFPFRPENPARTVADVLRQRPELAVPLGMHILPFREEVSKRIIRKVAKENALFSLATAIPDIIPLISLPWAIGEFASDTAFITANQIRMTFLLGAASDREIGYREQKGEIVSIMMGAFGWRAAARELVGKIPMGGGLIPKAAIAYAGTHVVGTSIERLYRVGRAYSRQERRIAYEEALNKGKALAGSMLERFKIKR